MENLAVTLNAAEGQVSVNYTGYDGGELTPALQKRLHDGLDHAIVLANSHAAKYAAEAKVKAGSTNGR